MGISPWPALVVQSIITAKSCWRQARNVVVRTLRTRAGLGYSTNGKAARALAAEITSAGGTALAIGADLRSPEAPGSSSRRPPKR
jgi:hypothetical protein